MSRSRISFYNTQGTLSQEIDTNAEKWGALKKDMDTKNIRYKGMKAMIGETQVSLGSDNDLVPEGSCTVFLMPEKVTSGD